jgi:hypothetical protein
VVLVVVGATVVVVGGGATTAAVMVSVLTAVVRGAPPICWVSNPKVNRTADAHNQSLLFMGTCLVGG